MACTNEVISDFTPGHWEVEGIKVGSSVKASWDFEKQNGEAIDISGDTFTTVIKNAVPSVVATLAIGSGHSITGKKTLNFLFGTPFTNTAGVYTFQTTWVRPSTGENRPVFEGTITVIA